VDPVADLGAEYAIDEPVLREPGQAHERRRRHDGVEVVAIAGHLGVSAGDRRLDPIL